MARRALLIGSQTNGLAGVDYDIEILTRILTDRDFTIDLRTGDDATRVGILDGYERLIAGSARGDAVVVYYTGHGGRVDNEVQYMVPADIEDSTRDDFRGITSFELSVLQNRLTDVTRNVVTILDCCHSGRMSRRTQGFVVKTRLQRADVDLEAHHRRLGLPLDALHPVSNPYAVRLTACAPWEQAYEYIGMKSRRVGMMTEAFEAALAEAGGVPVSWAVLVERIRDRVLPMAPDQRPGIEGPAHRLIFETTRADDDGLLPAVHESSNRIRIPGALLLGVRPDDELAVMVGPTAVGTATVTRLDGVTAEAKLTMRDGTTRVPAGARVRPVRTVPRPRAVAVHGTGERADRLRAALHAAFEAAALLTPAGTADEPFAEVTVGDEVLVRTAGVAVGAAHTADDGGIAETVGDLTRLARADVLRTAVPEPDEELPEPFTVEWGRVVDGAFQPLEPVGEAVHVGERVYVKVVNGGERPLYLTVFDIGVSGAVSVITSSDRNGVRVEGHGEHVVGRRVDGAVVGTALRWPEREPASGPRPESFLAVVSSEPQDLSALEQVGVAKATGDALPHRSSLQRMIARLATHGTREWDDDDDDDPGVRYAVRRIDFMLVPAGLPAEETAPFEIDERPALSVRTLAAVAPEPTAVGPLSLKPPPQVAVRIPEILVRRNRALWSADLRVDALVLTGGGPDGVPAYRAQTARFGRVRDGDRLSMDNLLIYHGPAVDFLDLAFWVSRDRRDSLELGDLLAESLTADDVREAAMRAIGAVVAGPQAVAAVMAVGGVAVIVNTAYKLLSAAVGDHVGIYRTSLLAVENFGIGRHPTTGLRPAQDFEFAYEVVDTT